MKRTFRARPRRSRVYAAAMKSFVYGVILASVAACSSGVSIDDFSQKLIDAQCTYAVACQQMPDVATCKGATHIDDYIATLVADSKSKKITYDEGQAGTCIDYFKSASCSFTGFHGPANPCTTVFKGTVAAGGACFVDEDCAGSGTCQATDPNCDSSAMCCPGTCMAAAQKVAIGGDCSNAPCVDNAACSFNTNKCVALATTAGAACDAVDGCADPMVCNIDFTKQPYMGTCITPAAHGATCDPNALIACADNRDYCDPTAKTCTSAIAVGQTCTAQQTCVGYADCTNGSCAARAGSGQACMAGSGSGAGSGGNCLGDLTCTSGSCAAPPAAMACH